MVTQVTLPTNLTELGIKQFQYNSKRIVSGTRFNGDGPEALVKYYAEKNKAFYAMHDFCPHGVEIGEDWKMPSEKDTKGFWFIEDNVIGFQLEADRTWYMMKYGKTD